MHILILLLLLAITSNRRSHGTQVALGAVLDTFTPVLQLALGLLLLAGGILLDTSLAQVLVADRVANGFLRRTDGLVPGAVGALRVVFGDGAGVGVGGDVAQLGGGVGVFVLDLSLLLGKFALGLVDVLVW